MVIQNNELRNGFGVQVWREVEKLQELHGIQFYRNSKGWWNHTLHKKWLQFHFGMNRNVPKLLLVDDFSGHLTQDVLDYCEQLQVHLLKVPPGYTGSCSPSIFHGMLLSRE